MSLKDLIGVRISYKRSYSSHEALIYGTVVDVYLKKYSNGSDKRQVERFAILRDDGYLVMVDFNNLYDFKCDKDEYLKQMVQKLRYIKPPDKEEITRE